MVGYAAHDLAKLFPAMSDTQFAELLADIKANGLREPVILFEDKVLDGWHRNRACAEAGVGCLYEQWAPRHDGDTPLAYVISVNLHRRHMDPAQLAMTAARLVTRGSGNAKKGEPPKVGIADAAAALKVNPHSVHSARAVLKHGTPELIAAVDAGRIKIDAAQQIAKKPPADQSAALAAGDTKEKPRAARVAPEPKQGAGGLLDEIYSWLGYLEKQRAQLDKITADDKALLLRAFTETIGVALRPA
ncbi:MAG TPA: ParB N-terminal domain-containing protein [Stellaceae bacterium]|nr:ParB N-terminal domain-containing protein [Stellaceae bacterium]